MLGITVLDDIGLNVYGRCGANLDDGAGAEAHHYQNIYSLAKKFFKDNDKPIVNFA